MNGRNWLRNIIGRKVIANNLHFENKFIAVVSMGSLADAGVEAYLADTLDDNLEEVAKWNLN